MRTIETLIREQSGTLVDVRTPAEFMGGARCPFYKYPATRITSPGYRIGKIATTHYGVLC